jgi:hypothetical protein
MEYTTMPSVAERLQDRWEKAVEEVPSVATAERREPARAGASAADTE